MYLPTECHCTIQQLIVKEKESVLKIVSTEKRYSEGSPFIVYIIQTKNMKQVKRRYSEFESFRNFLIRLFPVLLIPPIPEKHSLVEYTYKDNNDMSMIDKRKRMLGRFLSRIIVHPVLSQEHIFHRFIYGTESWIDIVQSSPLTELSRDPLMFFDITSIVSPSVIPIPSSSYILKHPHQGFEALEIKMNKTFQDKGYKLDQSQKRILKRLSDLSSDYSDLGSGYNALSLYEPYGLLSSFIEKLGQVIDDTCANTRDMTRLLESECSERIQDYAHYNQITQQALRYRRMKQAQLELIEETLGLKESMLVQALQRREEWVSQTFETEQDDFLDTESIEDDFAVVIKQDVNKVPMEEIYEYPESATQSVLRASKEQAKKWSSTHKLLSAVSLTFQGMLDGDPEQTRHNQITKLQNTIYELKEAKETTCRDLIEMSDMLIQDIQRVRELQDAELKSVLVSFAKIHLNYCEQ
ncbi:Autophagy-protein 20 [Rhizopus stolonifer]|uniref:Autophagy-protein 20 n=1 Tax=Rhizopus stolonifer TaxID=4846 RepID=A0A367KYJ8_RHIST|nr:Autophagy-protein 20 [Rhizopus stolonifer]